MSHSDLPVSFVSIHATAKPIDQSEQARQALRRLTPIAHGPHETVHVRAGKEDAIVPREALRLLLEILGQMAIGNAVTIVPVQAEFTTQQAADFLNVSRPYLISLLEGGRMPYRKAGTHRRIRFSDLSQYRAANDAHRKQALDELTADTQRLGMDY